MKTETKVISSGKKYRQVVDITSSSKGKKESVTRHEMKDVNGNWIPRVTIPHRRRYR